ncbi:MAG: COP23 domain-containing protein [Xenococcaceae cyanobacterium]
MKLLSLTKVLTAGAIALGGLTLASQPSQAQKTTFFCGISNGVPTTFASTSRGNVPVIRWVSSYFSSSGYTPERRCQEVSTRFQNYYNNGRLNYITTGIMNGQPVVCVTSSNGGSCSDLLFTLKQGQNASRTLQKLFDIRVGAAGPLYEGSNSSNASVYIDMNNYLKTAPVENATSPNPQTTSPPNNSNPPGAEPGDVMW